MFYLYYEDKLFQGSICIARQHGYACRARYCYRKSVLLSICHTLVLYETKAHIVKLFPSSSRGMTSFFERYRHYITARGTPSPGELKMHRALEKFAIFDRNHRLSQK